MMKYYVIFSKFSGMSLSLILPNWSPKRSSLSRLFLTRRPKLLPSLTVVLAWPRLILSTTWVLLPNLVPKLLWKLYKLVLISPWLVNLVLVSTQLTWLLIKLLFILDTTMMNNIFGNLQQVIFWSEA